MSAAFEREQKRGRNMAEGDIVATGPSNAIAQPWAAQAVRSVPGADRRLVIVSNRVAADSGNPDSGGLAVAIRAALENHGGMWFGWSGEVEDEAGNAPARVERGPLTYATLNLSRRDYNEYYLGFANRVLWPLFHFRGSLVDYSRARFCRLSTSQPQVCTLIGADAVAAGPGLGPRLSPDPARARAASPRLQPTDRVFSAHAVSRRPSCCGCCQTIAISSRHCVPMTSLAFKPRRTSTALGTIFFGSPAPKTSDAGCCERSAGPCAPRFFRSASMSTTIAAQAAAADGTRQIRRLRQSLGERTLMIGVDRLDYSKGLPARFQAFGQLLETCPETRGRIVFMQIAPPSRSEVPEYQEIRRTLAAAAGHINSRYGEFDWTPLRYINKSFNHRILTGFFRASRIGLVTPLRDGMNLVAKEYVASQLRDRSGSAGVVLLCRRGAGTGRGGLVNPHDVEGMAEAIRQGLDMPLGERRERWIVDDDDHRAQRRQRLARKLYRRALGERRPVVMAAGGFNAEGETWLVGDIGATNARFGLVSPRGKLLHWHSYACERLSDDRRRTDRNISASERACRCRARRRSPLPRRSPATGWR